MSSVLRDAKVASEIGRGQRTGRNRYIACEA